MTGPARGRGRASRRRGAASLPALLTLLAGAFLVLLGPAPAHALKAIEIADQERIELTTLGDFYESRGDSIQVETAAGADGMVARMSVAASTQGTNPNWIVFALSNSTDKPIERWLAADRYSVIGSGAVWPDLDARRIEAVTPSVGFVPERVKSDRADIFRITLEPGQTITYVAELSSERFVRIYLWKPLDYELKIADRQLFNGIMLGLTGLLAIFLTAIFAANHKLVFPASALVAWCTLAYLCVDFGFFHKLFQLRPEGNAVYRAAAEASLAASLVVFLHIFLRLALWHGLIRMLISVWLLAQFALIAVAVIDPRLAATFARLSFLGIGAIGAGLIMVLALRGQDRALSLIPTWILFLVWILGAGVTLTGRLSGDIAVSGLVAGLVLILLLIGFTVTQYAFRSASPAYAAASSELQLRSVALDAAGTAVWEWNARRDEIKVSPMIEASLGLVSGELSGTVEEYCRHLHQADRERFKLALWSMQERSDGRIHADFRLRQADNSYRWFELEAAAVPGNDPRSLKCVGLMRDVTDAKRAHERLLHDAIHDSLTGLPNRALMLDRLEVAMKRAKAEPQIRPGLLSIDIDKFKAVNASLGLVVGDSLLLTVARRLQRHVSPNDALARIGGDQFAILVAAVQSPAELEALGERIRRSLRSPIKIAGQEIVLTGSVGIAAYDGTETSQDDLLRKAEIAMYRSKRSGADRIETFRPDMRADRDERIALESDLKKALEKNQLKVLYQPIIYLPTEELAGFEALVRWDHPRLGTINPASFVPLAEESDLIVKLGAHVLTRAVADAAVWQKALPRSEKRLFVSVNISSRQLFRQDLIHEIRHILGRNAMPKGSLKLEISEPLVMENPEQATEILEWLKSAGADLVLDDFGTGYSSVAYLHRFAFDTIKIDRASIPSSNGGREGDGFVVVRSMVAFAHELGKTVVAEGVESADDVGLLRSIDCEYAEGPYYGDAIPEGEVIQLLRLVAKSESKLQPRGLFRAKAKKKKAQRAADRATGAATGTPAPAPTNGAAAAPPASAAAEPPAAPARPPATLPGSAIRQRVRPHSPLSTAGRPPAPAAAPPMLAPLPPAPLAGHGAPPPSASQRRAAPVQPILPAPPPPPAPFLPPQLAASGGRAERSGPPPIPPAGAGPPPGDGLPISADPASRPHAIGTVGGPPPVHFAQNGAHPPAPIIAAVPPAPKPSPAPALQPVPPPVDPMPPEYRQLPPAIAESLARLAGAIPPKPKG